MGRNLRLNCIGGGQNLYIFWLQLLLTEGWAYQGKCWNFQIKAGCLSEGDGIPQTEDADPREKLLREILCPVLCWGSELIIIMVLSGLKRSVSQILHWMEVICGFHFYRLFKDTKISANIVKKSLLYSFQNASLQFSINQLTPSANGTLLILVLELWLQWFDTPGSVLYLHFCNTFCSGTRPWPSF